MVEYWRLKLPLSILLLLVVSPKITTFIAVCKLSFLVQVGTYLYVWHIRNLHDDKNYAAWEVEFEVNNFDTTTKAQA